MNPLYLILLGGPGSGKGTHGKALAEEFNLLHISTGAFFRKEISAKTPLGITAARFISQGQLVPDELASRLLDHLLDTLPWQNGFILDGFPRSFAQARDLNLLLQRRQIRLSRAIYLNISDEEIMTRLSGRLTCGNCEQTFHEKFNPPKVAGVCPSCGGKLFRRDDDQPETIRKRIAVFHREFAPILDFYRQQKLLCEIKSEGPPAEVKALIVEQFKSLSA